MFACFFDLAQKSESAKEGYEKRYREIHDRSVENGYKNVFASRKTGYNAECRIHRSRSSGADGRQGAEKAYQERSEEQCYNFTEYVGHKRYRSQLRPFLLGYEYRRERIIPESGTYGHAVVNRIPRYHKGGQSRKG